jgi:Flp pilus assembly pilin Flp
MQPFIITIVDQLRRFVRQTRGQDMIEYALIAGFLAVAAGAIVPNLVTGISRLFSETISVMTRAASQS